MAINTTWTDTAFLDRDALQTLPESTWDQLVSNINVLERAVYSDTFFYWRDPTTCVATGSMMKVQGMLYVQTRDLELANTGLAALTRYYVYAFVSGGLLTLEASTTTRAGDTTAKNEGNIIKSGDASRTVVGQLYTSTQVYFENTPKIRTVRTHWRRQAVLGRAYLGVETSKPDTSFVAIDTGWLSIGFLIWDFETLEAHFTGSVWNSGANNTFSTFDVETNGSHVLLDAHTAHNGTGAGSAACSYVTNPGELTEDYHILSVYGKVSAGTGTWKGSGTVGERCTLTMRISG